MISLCSIIESNSYLRSPHSKQINLGLLWGTQIGATCTSAFPSPHSKQTINSYFITFLGVHAFGNVAFDNEVVMTDDGASSLRRLMSPLSQNKGYPLFWVPRGYRATRTTAFLLPKANRQVLVYFGDPIFLQTDTVLNW